MLFIGMLPAYAQSDEDLLQTFGYFQASFRHDENTLELETNNSFNVQQLNLIFQKNLSRQWVAFINFELLNNFSSSRRWGSLDLDEAWVSYRTNKQLTVKAGLHVPVFNNLNEIKNRTPLLPYIIRPLVYEESFAEIIQVDEFIPNRAFLQANGTLPVGKVKFDFAGYLGNSPNINSLSDNEEQNVFRQTGVDTTVTVLVGGRVGLRIRDLKLGISGTRETVNFFRELTEESNGQKPLLPGISPDFFNGVVRSRFGADFSFHFNRLFFEGEFIAVNYGIDVPSEIKALPDGSPPVIDLDRSFYYGTIGYEIGEHLLVYGSYWNTSQSSLIQTAEQFSRQELDISVYTMGIRYTMLQDKNGFDRIALKAQYAHAPIDDGRPTVGFTIDETQKLNLYALAVSVLF